MRDPDDGPETDGPAEGTDEGAPEGAGEGPLEGPEEGEERAARGLKGGTLHERLPSKEAIQEIVARHLKAYEERHEPGPFGPVSTFHVREETDLADRFDRVRRDLRALDPRLMALLRRERGEDVLRITPRPRPAEERSGLPAFLFAATVVTVTLSGAYAWISWRGIDDLAELLSPAALGWGALTFALPLLAVLLVHEAAHHFAARAHGVTVSRPYFIPVPPIVFFPSMGTFGSIVSVWDPMPTRKALFDLGVSGPLAGFAAALPVLLVGLSLTASAGVPVPTDEALQLSVTLPDGTVVGDGGRSHPAVLFTSSTEENFTRTVTVNLTGRDHGGSRYVVGIAAPEAASNVSFRLSVRWVGSAVAAVTERGNASAVAPFTVGFDRPADAAQLVASLTWERIERGSVTLGEPLAFRALARLSGTPSDLLIHPTALAGWVALLITSINLLPAGQMDGGHVARALLGANMRWASYVAVAGLMLASFAFVGWVYLVLLIVLFTGIQHPAPLDDHTPLDPRRRIVAGLALLVFALSFVPVPVSGL